MTIRELRDILDAAETLFGPEAQVLLSSQFCNDSRDSNKLIGLHSGGRNADGSAYVYLSYWYR